MNKLVLLFTVFLFQPAFAVVQALPLSGEAKWPAPRWIFGQEKLPAGDSANAVMAVAKRAQMMNDPDTCLKKAESAHGKVKSVRSWLALLEVECALKLKPSTANANRLAKTLEPIEKSPLWLFRGPQAVSLRTQVIKGYLSLLEQDLKNNRARAWRSVENLQGLLIQMDEKSRAKLWRLAGELSFLQQKTEASRDYFRRSLAEADSEEVRQRLSVVEQSLGVSDSGATKPILDPALELSKDEQELVDRVASQLKAGDLVSAVDDAIKIITQFPGSTRAKWASDRIMEAYWSLSDKTDQKYVLSKQQMLKQMEKGDAERLAIWARAMYNRGQWEDSLAIVRRAIDATTGTALTPILDLGAKAAIATDNFDVARDYFNRLKTQHAGTAASREAHFRSGLLHYRMGDHAAAIADFEKSVALPQNEKFELLARYWLWRSLQKMKSERADLVADEIMVKFPFSYYGLRARIERGGSKALEWKPESGKSQSKMWLTPPEKETWERAQVLMKAGWLDEAQSELNQLPPAFSAEDKAVRSVIWGAAGGYVRASKLANEAWDEKPEFRRPPFVDAAFPREFNTDVLNQAAARKLDSDLVRGLIKQESSFNVRATSSANAFGLMQMVPGTAKEIAQDLKLGTINLPDDMFQPTRNIQMGTYYLSRMVTKFQGHVPLALAAYNAGPYRIQRWLNSRPSMKNVPLTRSSSPDEELWFDEIPYWETSFYVKAILRNFLIYKMLEKGRVEIPDPVWAQQSSTAPSASP